MKVLPRYYRVSSQKYRAVAVVITPSSAERQNHNVKTTHGTLFREQFFFEHFISPMTDQYSFSVQKIRFLNHVFKLLKFPNYNEI
jgi:hypothetical protein